METPEPRNRAAGAEARRSTRSHAVRSILLAIAATWFLVLAFLRVEGDPAIALVSLIQAFAFGFVFIALALIDWREFRWWWLALALLLVVVVWMATGHPLLFGVGFT